MYAHNSDIMQKQNSIKYNLKDNNLKIKISISFLTELINVTADI